MARMPHLTSAHQTDGLLIPHPDSIKGSLVFCTQKIRRGRTQTLMYALVEEDFTEAAAFAASAVEQQKKRHHCIPKEKIASGKTKDGETYFINEYPATATYSQWERVAYIQLPGAVGYVVLSSRNEGIYRKDKHFLEDVMKTIFYVRKAN
jgi:hypothetical protein